jgi:sugar phosphate permease
MEQILDFFSNNYEWIFSGIGVFIISFFLIRKSKGQKQKVGNNSVGIQAGRDVKIKKFKNKKNV